jgi:hypothetical protein
MFEDIIWFFIILFSSILIRNLLLRRDTGPFKSILVRLAYIGVLVHELSHFAMSLVAGIVPRGIKVKYRSEITRMPNPHGSVNIGPKRNFLQASLICLAPLYISTWLIFWSLAIAFNALYTPLIRILAGFFCFSLFTGAAPSNPDFKIIFRSFQKDPSHSMYQISLVSLSVLLNWVILTFYQITFMLDVYYYVVIVITYYFLKYGVVGINKTINNLRLRYFQGSIRLNRKNFNSLTHRKIKIEEAQW